MKKKLVPIIASIALALSSYNTVYANEISEEAVEEVNNTLESNEENTETLAETEPADSSDENCSSDDCNNTASNEQSPHEESNADEQESSESGSDNNSNEEKTIASEDSTSQDSLSEEIIESSDELTEELEEEIEEEIEEDAEEDVEEIETCTISISYQQEEYEIVNLCPTDEIIISSTEATISIAKGEAFLTLFEGTIINEDLAKKINLPETIQEDCEISFYVNIDGDITSSIKEN